MGTTDDLRRLTEQSRVRLASVRVLHAQHLLILAQSRRRFEETRRLLGQRRASKV